MVDTLLSLKIALIFILFGVCYLGLIPAYSKHCRKNETALSMMNAFAGGVFLAMAFIHILPEAVETYNDIMTASDGEHGHEEETTNGMRRRLQMEGTNETKGDSDETHSHIFPLPYLLFFGGYCLVLLVDRVFAGHFSHGHSHGHSHGEGGKHHHHHNEEGDIIDIHGTHAHHDHHGFHNNCGDK
jgi:zinc transporter ZupT